MKKPFILCADLHIRDDQPKCRQDNFTKTLWKKFKYLKSVQNDLNNCPILVAGDIFHHWRARPYLINKCLKRLPKNMLCIAGNHDLPYHNINQLKQSALETLVRAGRVKLIDGLFIHNQRSALYHIHGFHYGIEPINVDRENGITKIAVIHRLITEGVESPWRNSSSESAKSLIKSLKGYDLIVTGDNHNSFTVQIQQTLLVNPGSFTRQTAAQMEHKPCFYIWDSVTGEIEKVILPHDDKSVSNRHLKREKERNQRMESFVQQLNDDYEIGLHFEKNLEIYFEANKEPKSVRNMVWKSVQAI